MPRQWGTLKNEWYELPGLTHEQKKRVKAALKFAEVKENHNMMDFDAIVTDAALLDIFTYNISEGKVLMK